MIEYSLEPFHEIAEYVISKNQDHAADSGYGELPNMDIDYYYQASHLGACRAVTVRDSGKLVGYSVFFIANSPNHKHIIEATNAGIFVEKPYRGKVSLMLINKADLYLKALGVHEIHYLLKDDRIGKLLARKGYKPEHKLWSTKL